MSVYEDIKAIESTIDAIVADAEEFTPEVEQKLSLLIASKQATIGAQAEWLCKLRANKQADLTGVQGELLRLVARRERLHKTIDWAEKELYNLYQVNDNKKIETGTFIVSARKYTKVVVDDGFYNEKYMRVKTTSEPDKAALGDALKAGIEIEGARLATTEKVTIK